MLRSRSPYEKESRLAEIEERQARFVKQGDTVRTEATALGIPVEGVVQRVDVNIHLTDGQILSVSAADLVTVVVVTDEAEAIEAEMAATPSVSDSEDAPEPEPMMDGDPA